MAEREGFEPSKPFWGLRDFESRAFDHSATSPCMQNNRFSVFEIIGVINHSLQPSLCPPEADISLHRNGERNVRNQRKAQAPSSPDRWRGGRVVRAGCS